MSPSQSDSHSAESLMEAWKSSPLTKPFPPRPRLLWTASEVDALREAMAPQRDAIARRAQEVIDDASIFASEPAWDYRHQSAIVSLATAAWLLGEERLVSLATRLMDRAASAECWVADVHQPMKCDHVAANVGATIARCMDLLAGRLTDDYVERYRTAVREKCLDPFLDSCRDRSEWWAKRDCPSNWRIMTCGDAGLAALGTLDGDDDTEEILAYAAEGVVDILDSIPEDGDFVEGPQYFVGKLALGLRYLLALSRIWPQAADWLRHPRLEPGGDFLLHVTEPGGRTFDYFDNKAEWNDLKRGCMLLMARTQRRGDLAWLGRAGDLTSLDRLAFDDPSLPSEPPEGPTSMHFRTSGVVTCRSDWSGSAAYLALRSGPSTFGHSHLDSGSFIFSSGGTRLLVDEGTWPYAHMIGFFDKDRRRWDFDANATVGHNTLLIDGKGQVYGADHPGAVTAYQATGLGTVVACDLTKTYEGVAECVRRFVFLPSGVVVLYDLVRSDDPCHVEQLFHCEGAIEGDDQAWSVEKDGARLHVTRLPGRSAECPWRVNNVERTTCYTASTGAVVERSVRYRSWGPIQAATRHDLVTVLSLAGSTPGAKLDVDDGRLTVSLDGTLAVFGPGPAEVSIARL